MKETWQKAIKFVLDHEGGYNYHPQDPGGETNFGISKRSYPSLNIATLTEDEAKKIYKADYWDMLKLDDILFPFDILIFDTAVNCGIGRANKWMDESDHWEQFLLKRIFHYVKLAQNVKYQPYLRGWLNRVMDLYEEISQDA